MNFIIWQWELRWFIFIFYNLKLIKKKPNFNIQNMQMLTIKIILFCTCSIWASKLHRLDKFLLYTVADRNIAFSGTPSTCYLVSFGNLIVNPVHFLLTEKYQKRQLRENYIILLSNSKYKRQWINLIFLQDKHNINAVS